MRYKRAMGQVQSQPIEGKLTVKVNEQAALTVKKGSIWVLVCSEEFTETAKNQPLDQTRLEKQLEKENRQHRILF